MLDISVDGYSIIKMVPTHICLADSSQTSFKIKVYYVSNEKKSVIIIHVHFCMLGKN